MIMTTFRTLDPSKLISCFTRPTLRLTCLVAAVALMSTHTSAQKPAPEPTLVLGSEVSLSSAAKAEWIQGEAPKAFEPGKVYIFECWSTWCGPCIGMIPHVNELHKKYHDKGLRIYGMSVWENDKAKVEKFVKRRGDEMSYPVAFTGKGGAFEIEWMNAAGAKSIPHAFIVRNGKLLASTQASRLTEPVIEQLLSGDEGAKKAAAKILSAQTHQGKTDKLLSDFYSARKSKKAEKMNVILKDLKVLDPDNPAIRTMELWILVVSEDWPAAITALNELPASEPQNSFISGTSRVARDKNNLGYPEIFVKALLKPYSDYVLRNEFPIGPNHYVSLSTLQWRMGDKQSALITADKGIAAAKVAAKGKKPLVTPYVRFAKSVKEGTMPESSEISTWLRAGYKEIADAKKAKTEE